LILSASCLNVFEKYEDCAEYQINLEKRLAHLAQAPALMKLNSKYFLESTISELELLEGPVNAQLTCLKHALARLR
jgi:hypothetical protein